MNRIWNFLARGFRARPSATPSQTSSQWNDENDAALETASSTLNENHNHIILKTDFTSLKNDRFSVISNEQLDKLTLWALSRHENGKERDYRKFKCSHDSYFMMWDHMAYAAASVLFLRFVGNYVVNKKVPITSHESCNKSVIGSNVTNCLCHKWNLKIDDIFLKLHNKTLQNILAKVLAVQFPCSIVYAAGEIDKPQGKLSIKKTCGRTNAILHESSPSHASSSTSEKDFIVFDAAPKSLKPVTDTFLSDEELESFVSSVQECAGKAYNVQGIDCYQKGDYEEAFNCFQLGVQDGSSRAQFNLGLCYQLGKGTKKDLKQAIKQYQRAARQGHEMAQYNLALMLLETNELVNHTHALSLLEQASEQGLLQAQSLLGAYLTQKGPHYNMKKAVKTFQLGTDQEDPLSTYHLAECYEHGLGDLDVDSIKAFDLYASAAGLGHLEAHFKMASILSRGCEGIERNEDLAMEIFKKASDLGHVTSSQKFAELEQKKQSRLEMKEKENDKKASSSSMHHSHYAIPSLVQALSPLSLLLNKDFDMSPKVEDFSVTDSMLDEHFRHSLPLVPLFHRVSTWPHNFLQWNTTLKP